MKVAIYTLGCKVNQYETQAMERELLRRGHTLTDFDGVADAYIVNTCSVTAVSDKKSRQMIRRCRKQNPEAVVAACGCYVQTHAEEAAKLDMDLIAGTGDHMAFLDLLEQEWAQRRGSALLDDALRRRRFEALPGGGMASRTRAMLKVEDGCVNFCTYCIIPFARGPVRSLPLDQAVAETARLAAEGYRELVLTGIHLTSYGRDLGGKTDLADAVEAAASSGVERIRLGSLEPVIATEAFIERIRNIPALCPQFHLALQSGSDAVLRRMRRRYTRQEFLEAADRLKAAFPGCAVTTDIITGFPGETEEDFGQSCALVREIGFARIHVFPYSARKGTPAASMPDQLPRAVREERARALIQVGRQAAADWARTQTGRVRPVLVEDEEDGLYRGYTPEYAPVLVSGAEPGELVPVRLDAWTGEAFRGTCIRDGSVIESNGPRDIRGS